MRFINILLVLLFVGVLAAGAYLLGNRVNSDANDALTSTLPEGAAAAAAEAGLKPALFAANAYFVDNSTYEGMTADKLRSSYDAGLASGLEVSNASASGFCIEIEIETRTYSYVDRNGAVAPGDGC